MPRLQVHDTKPLNCAIGSWAQLITESRVYYCRVWLGEPKFTTKISRPKTSNEEKVELKSMFNIDCLIRPLPTKTIPKANKIKLKVLDGTISKSTRLIRNLILGWVIRPSCVLEIGSKYMVLECESQGKSKDVLVTVATEIELVNSDLRKTPCRLFWDRLDLLYDSGLDLPLGILVSGASGTGKTKLAKDASICYNTRLYTISGCESVATLLLKLPYIFNQAKKSPIKPIILLDDFDLIYEHAEESVRKVLATLLTLMEANKDAIIIMTATRVDLIDKKLGSSHFYFSINLSVPSPIERKELLKEICGNAAIELETDALEQFGEWSGGFVMGDVYAFAKNLLRLYGSQRNQINSSQLECIFKVSGKASLLRNENLKLKPISWDNLGGLERLKHQLEQIIDWPMIYPKQVERFNIKPIRGLLLYGPPGCSKTTIARLLGSTRTHQFFSLSGAQIYDSQVGESESILRNLFAKARAAHPSIIFIDEVDTIVGRRGYEGDGNRVQARILSTLLNEMDGIEGCDGVLVVGATNRPDMIDDAMMRPGRFDRVIYIPPPDLPARIEIFKIYTRGYGVEKIIPKLAEMTDGFTGADIQGLCARVGMELLRHPKQEISLESFSLVLEDIKPSVTMSMVKQYEAFHLVYGG